MKHDLSPKKFEVKSLPDRYLLDLRAECNLKCPMCLLHGVDVPNTPEKQAVVGTMEKDLFIKLIDEIKQAKPLVQPSWWGEPFLIKNFKQVLDELKNRDITVAINTNGLNLTESKAKLLIQNEVDAVFFSLDAITADTLKKVRGVHKIDKIKKNINLLLNIREQAKSNKPRIGVSFTIQEDNEHEYERFIREWVQIVDVIRVGWVFENGKILGITTPEKRLPCNAIYQTMPIHYNGDVSICCFDSHGSTIMGNVFADGGVEKVWHGQKFTLTRQLHEEGRADEIPICKDCNAWSGHLYSEEYAEIDNVKVLIRKSPQFLYYNRIDRLDSWHKGMKGHAEVDLDRIKFT